MAEPSLPRRPGAIRPAARVPGAPDEAPDPDFWGPDRRTRRHDRARREPVPFRSTVGLDAVIERIREWRPSIGAIVIAVAALVVGVVWYQIGLGASDAGTRGASVSSGTVARTEPAATSPAPTQTSPPSSVARRSRGSLIVVHVAGAVATPGVIELPAGSRVVDALEATGGALPDADIDRLNLAAKLVDGQRVLVVRKGDPPVAEDALGLTGGEATAPAEPVNLNTASAAQFEALPGIGPVLAQAIVTERQHRGGFRSVNELRDVRGIGERRFKDLEHRVSI